MEGIRGKLALVGLDIVLLSLAYLSAFWLRVGWDQTLSYTPTIVATLPFVLVVGVFVHLRQGLFNAILRYASLDTAIVVFRSVLLSVLVSCLLIFLLFRLEGLPRSVFVIYAMSALLLVGGSRLIVRFVLLQKGIPTGLARHRVLLYGAGDTAELVIRGLKVSRAMDHVVVGLVDENRSRWGRSILGVKIHGGVRRLPSLIETLRADEIWICVHDLPGQELRRIYAATERSRVKIKMLPRLETAFLGRDIDRLQEPNIADLLRRPPRSLNRGQMKRWIEGRRVLITGAGGSIGSELATQIARFRPGSLSLCDACEAHLFSIHREVEGLLGGAHVAPYLVDVRDRAAVRRMFAESRPELVFHAAAYKHVPLVELHPGEGALTNIKGLHEVAAAALDVGTRNFVFVSTDKAVRPSSIMGATKRVGEIVVRILDGEGATRFTAVRFGNVLGSSGSVVPIFQDQIRRGGPVTVTHADMTRYFMLVSEAVELVIQAGAISEGGEVFILDMGKPVRIAEMASDLIRLMGREEGRDIRIEYTGPRPGEKIHEELLFSPTDCATAIKDIWVDGQEPPAIDRDTLETHLRLLYDAARQGKAREVVVLIKELVPSFQPTYPSTRKLLEEETSKVPSNPLPSRSRELRLQPASPRPGQALLKSSHENEATFN